jgi:hypothetical protein
MQVGELCKRLKVPYRHARYVLEQAILPEGVEEKPGRGDHRQLSRAQAFWLGIVLMLKRSGVRAPLAGKIADFARDAVRGVTQNLNWDWTFAPFLGKFESRFRWFVDIGDLEYVRLATTAHPGHEGVYEFSWSFISQLKTAEGVAPIVTLRIDLGRLANLLRD